MSVVTYVKNILHLHAIVILAHVFDKIASYFKFTITASIG